MALVFSLGSPTDNEYKAPGGDVLVSRSFPVLLNGVEIAIVKVGVSALFRQDGTIDIAADSTVILHGPKAPK